MPRPWSLDKPGIAGWLRVARRRDVVFRSLKVGGIVGTLLTVINQSDALMAGNLNADALVRIFLTYCVPYCVSTYASVSALRNPQDETIS